MAEKAPKYEVLDPKDHEGTFSLLQELVAQFHTDIVDAEIALAFVNDVKPDRDGSVWWGRAKKVAELERQFHAHDFIILLNKKVWYELPAAAKQALLDHELSHCGAETDEKTGDVTYVMRKHDVEEFVHIVRRYGLWKEDVKALIDAALKREQKDLFPEGEKAVKDFADAIPAGVKVTLSMGEQAATIDKS